MLCFIHAGSYIYNNELVNHIRIIQGKLHAGFLEQIMKRPLLFLLVLALNLAAAGCSKTDQSPEVTLPAAAASPALSGTESFTVMVSGTDVGQLEVEHSSGAAQIDFEYRDNGRGPTIRESVMFGETHYFWQRH